MNFIRFRIERVRLLNGMNDEKRSEKETKKMGITERKAESPKNEEIIKCLYAELMAI